MSVGKAVFCSKNRSDFEDSLEISLNTHLFVKLGRLGETACGLEVVDPKYVGTTLTGAPQHFRRVDFYELMLVEELPEQLADHALQPEDALLGRSP